MEGMSFETPKGTMTFRKEDHQAMQDMYHFKIKVDPAFAWGVPELVREIKASEMDVPIRTSADAPAARQRRALNVVLPRAPSKRGLQSDRQRPAFGRAGMPCSRLVTSPSASAATWLSTMCPAPLRRAR
jgi:hypothetical protein